MEIQNNGWLIEQFNVIGRRNVAEGRDALLIQFFIMRCQRFRFIIMDVTTQHAYVTDAYHVNGKYAARQDLTIASMFCSVDGERRAREDDDRYLRKYTVLDGPNQQFCISDAALLNDLGRLEKYEAEVEKCGNKGPYYKADSIAELAELMKVDPTVLCATVERYNGFCEAGEDADFGKNPELLNAIDEGPFYAVKTTFLGFDYVGGIETANDGAVIKADGTAIPGLYAAGFTSSREFLGTGSAHRIMEKKELPTFYTSILMK